MHYNRAMYEFVAVHSLTETTESRIGGGATAYNKSEATFTFTSGGTGGQLACAKRVLWPVLRGRSRGIAENSRRPRLVFLLLLMRACEAIQ